ncbi:hypothetical protein D7V93_14675 [Corallococcus llansteffanensis]|uniref:Ricin B lectin domain-containing protein n=1 Tax=Corallococcus llansteffanensis TaxID=2316731 RepID=A0A3A8Q0N7_9BACT|nr:hypothetical protein D7V93_14675 [Corallococcus llansteffanensis]
MKDIVRLVPAGPVEQLRKVTLWMSPQYAGFPPTAEFHYHLAWLRQHGRNPAMAENVEISNVLIYESEARRMPLFMLHELAHAYHHRVLGGGNADIQAAFTRASASKTYERVERFRGPGVSNSFERAYAMDNAHEFFAEVTEAFFGRNDYYPFTGEDLARHDPATLALLQKVWQTPQTPAPLPQSVPQVPETVSFDSRCYYRLTTQWRGDGLSLDIINDGKNNTPILAKTAMVPGQLWKLLPEANGAHRLVTQWRGKGLSLAHTAGNQPLLVDTAAAPEQLWRVTPELDGTLRLTNLAQDASLSLDILYDGKANITPILARTRHVSGQLWNVTLVAPCP